MNNIEVRYVKNGLASNYGTHVELNENLKLYPELQRKILAHELKHTNKAFSKEDLALDLKEASVPQMELVRFMFKYPRAFLQIIPLYYSKEKGLVYDPNMLITYFGIASIVALGIFLGLKFL